MEQQIPQNLPVEVTENVTEQAAVQKNPWAALFDLAGWKKDLRKFAWLLLIVLLGLGAWALLRYALKNPLGLRFQTPVEFVRYQKYAQIDGTFSFAYPTRYVFDNNDKNRYGDSYLAGFHLKNDQRTGCDVRLSGVALNFAKSDQEISAALEKELANSVKGFANYVSRRIKLNKEPAFEASFDLTDPLGNTLRVTQTLVSHGEKSYLLVCGSSQAQTQYFTKDFQVFQKSFRWGK